MGRVKKYSAGNKHRRTKREVKKRVGKDSEMADDKSMTESAMSSLSVAKKKQIFKKSKDGRREVKK